MLWGQLILYNNNIHLYCQLTFRVILSVNPFVTDKKCELVIRDRPFERTITLQKDSTGHVGFQYKNGKITHLVTDSSAARNGLLIDHQICEVGGQCVIGMKVKNNVSFINGLIVGNRRMTLWPSG